MSHASQQKRATSNAAKMIIAPVNVINDDVFEANGKAIRLVNEKINGYLEDAMRLSERGADKEAFEVKKLEIAAEIGDVLWYCANLANDLGINLSDIASENYSKLSGRSKRGTLGGDGDNR